MVLAQSSAKSRLKSKLAQAAVLLHLGLHITTTRVKSLGNSSAIKNLVLRTTFVLELKLSRRSSRSGVVVQLLGDGAAALLAHVVVLGHFVVEAVEVEVLVHGIVGRLVQVLELGWAGHLGCFFGLFFGAEGKSTATLVV